MEILSIGDEHIEKEDIIVDADGNENTRNQKRQLRYVA